MSKAKPSSRNGMPWFRNNKAAQKWTEEEAEKILLELYDYVVNNEAVVLQNEVELKALTDHAVSRMTLVTWVTQTYKDNIRIVHIWEMITNILRTRVIKDQVVLRTNAQNLVMMNDHNYRERKEEESRITATVNMPTVKIESHDVIFNVGDAKIEKTSK